VSGPGNVDRVCSLWQRRWIFTQSAQTSEQCHWNSTKLLLLSHILVIRNVTPSFFFFTDACRRWRTAYTSNKVYVERGETKKQNAEKQLYSIIQ